MGQPDNHVDCKQADIFASLTATIFGDKIKSECVRSVASNP